MTESANTIPGKGLTDEPFGSNWQVGRGERQAHNTPKQQKQAAPQLEQLVIPQPPLKDVIFDNPGGQLSNSAHSFSARGADRYRT